jgi:hypothetical protein
MSDRRILEEETNKINQLYQEYDLQMRKAGASMEQRQQMRDMMNAKKAALVDQYGDHLQNMNAGKGVLVPGGTVSKAAKDAGEGIDVADIRKKGIIKGVGKKMLGALPLVGMGMAIADSPAASASELIQDPKIQRAAFSELAGPVGDAIDIAGDVAEYGLDEYRDYKDKSDMEKSESQAKKDYAKSPARLDKLKTLMGRK